MFAWFRSVKMRTVAKSKAFAPVGLKHRGKAPSRFHTTRETPPATASHAAKDRNSMEMLFEMDISTDSRKSSLISTRADLEESTSSEDNSLEPTIEEIKEHTALNNDFGQQLMKAVMLAITLCQQDGLIDLEKLEAMLQKLNFVVKLVDEAKQRRSSCDSFVHVRHPFLLCFGAREGGICGELPFTSPMPFIVDPYFKAQFDVQNPSHVYSAVMECLPQVYVGTYDQLRELVRVLCREMKQSFDEMQYALPPWRTLKSMLSRWTIPLQIHVPNEGGYDLNCEFVGSL